MFVTFVSLIDIGRSFLFRLGVSGLGVGLGLDLSLSLSSFIDISSCDCSVVQSHPQQIRLSMNRAGPALGRRLQDRMRA